MQRRSSVIPDRNVQHLQMLMVVTNQYAPLPLLRYLIFLSYTQNNWIHQSNYIFKQCRVFQSEFSCWFLLSNSYQLRLHIRATYTIKGNLLYTLITVRINTCKTKLQSWLWRKTETPLALKCNCSLSILQQEQLELFRLTWFERSKNAQYSTNKKPQ